MKNYEDELEVLMLHNPLGGKPKKIGSTVILGLEKATMAIDMSEIKEDGSIRFHCGYCHCGRKSTIGEKRALILIKTLMERLGLHTKNDIEARMLNLIISYPQGR